MCLLPFSLSAHSEGSSFEAELDGYFIDVGYEPEFPSANEQTRFDFSLTSDAHDASFTDVWVYIEKDGVIYFSGGIHKALFGPTGLSIILPESGTYIFSTRFQNEGALVVKSEFSLDIPPSADQFLVDTNYPFLLAGLLAGFLFGCLSVFLKRRLRLKV
jgi:hypothetical protein